MIKEDTASETSDTSASDSDVKNAGSYKRQTKKPSCKKRKRMIEEDTETETGVSAASIHVENAGSDIETCDMSKLYAVMKKGEKIAEAQLDDSNKIVLNGEKLIFIKKIFNENIEKTGAPDLIVGNIYPWPEEGFNIITQVRYMEGEKV